MTTYPDIVVGRDRAHVKTLVSNYPHSEVISASAFFDKVRLLAFFAHNNFVRDDYAPLIIAHRILSQNALYPPRFAKSFASLYSSCFHGTSTPSEVADSLDVDEQKLFTIFAIVKKIDEEMAKTNLVTGVAALFYAWKIMRSQKTAPFSLINTRVSLFHLVDLTMLEIEVIKELSRLGVRFDIHFPLDFSKRGINVAVDFSAGLFERESDLNNIELSFENIAENGPLSDLLNALFTETSICLSTSACNIVHTDNLLTESDTIASRIAQIISGAGKRPSIAIAVRSLDVRSDLLKQSLQRFGISVRDRKGVPLVKTPAGILLETLIAAKLDGLAKKTLIGLINYPHFSFFLSDQAQRARIVKLVDDLGIDDRFMVCQLPSDRYRSQLDHFSAIASFEHRKDDVMALNEWLRQVDELLMPLSEHDHYSGFLRALLQIIDRAMTTDHSSMQVLRDALTTIASSKGFSKDDPILTLHDFWHMLQSQLSTLTAPREDNPHLDAVELLLLPELLGRKFDHVFIADISFGRMPMNASSDGLLDDGDRLAVNRIMKKPLLRIFLDDPFEPMPVPPRQALEPFWFACAIASATSSVHFSCAKHDEMGQEQAPSEFFIWLLERVNLVEDSDFMVKSPWVSLQQQRFWQAQQDKLSTSITQSIYAQAAHERKLAFFENKTSNYAFSFVASDVINAFDGRLGQNPQKALSPTLVEAFAECRLKGFLERILNIESRAVDADDVDARTIGQIAHRALERFYFAPASKEHRLERLTTTIRQAVDEFKSNHYVKNPLILLCHEEWLLDSLASLINFLEEEREKSATKILGKELTFGFQQSAREPISIHANGRSYLLGGRIDRVDHTQNGLLIIDYKLSSSDSLKSKLNPQKFFDGNFQAPIYLRLVARYFAQDDRSKLAFSFASIRDGEILPPVSQLGYEQIFDQIFDDQHANSLAREIDRIFSPISRGEIPARAGDHCSHCDFTYVCRRTESL